MAEISGWRGFIQRHHHLLMLLGCLLPIAVLAVAYVFFDRSSPYFWLIFLLCPLSHFFLMREMHSGKDQDQGDDGVTKHKKECH